jgi:hypothetical protein
VTVELVTRFPVDDRRLARRGLDLDAGALTKALKINS